MATPSASNRTQDDDLLLRVTPPRVPAHQLPRPHLQADAGSAYDRPVVLVQAPAGFGKTSLLAQWRREHLARGRAVAWLLAQPQDDPERLVRALAMAVRTGAGRPAFGHTLLQAAAPSGLEGVTLWLAEVAQSALDLVLVVDEADRLPPAARHALTYLLCNAPSNLRAVVGARSDCDLGLDDLAAYGTCAHVGAEQLRFRLDETLALVRARLGSRVERDDVARLHELTEGWPLGLQLALAVIGGGSDPRAEIARLAAQGGSLHGRLVQRLLANLDAADAALLVRAAILDPLHPELCAAVLATGDAAQRLARLVRDTPVFTVSEDGPWLRMHALARDELRRRFAALDAAERATLHARAAEWLAAHGQFVDAAGHALEAGERERAYDLAERSLYTSLMSEGRQSAVLDWLGRLPAPEVERRPRLLLAAAWSLALSERHDEAAGHVERLLARGGADDALRCECALIQSGAAVFADDPDRFAALHDPWAERAPLRDPLLLQVYANRSAFRALVDGEPALARLRQQQVQRGAAPQAPGYIARWGDFIVGLSYLREGQVRRAEAVLRPALDAAEAELGRRSPFACMLAALLAAAVWERNQPDEAAALLANRLDVLERSGLPDAVLLGYRTAARIAAAEGAEHRVLELLGALDAVGIARRLPRLCVVSLAEQVRLHARRFRAETCRDLCARLDAMFADPAWPQGPRWRRSAELLRDVAQGYAAVAAQDWRAAGERLAQAGRQAQAGRYGRLHIELLALRALALDRCGERSTGLLREAADLAETHGLARVFDDAHPALGDWARQALGDSANRARPTGTDPLAAPMRAPPPPAPKERVAPSAVLTPKEREVLELAARNLSNKEIGLAMQVGEETIKWHMKNLFAKLDAGTRKQVVSRARILGLLLAP